MSDEKEVTLEVTADKKGEAKTVSLWGMIVAFLWIAGWSSAKYLGVAVDAEMWEIILGGFALAGIFSPVYLSIFMDKLRDVRLTRN